MKNVVKLLSVGTALFAFNIVANANTTIKEIDNYTENTYIIGYTRFSNKNPQMPITAELAAQAGQAYERISGYLGWETSTVKVYFKNESDGAWYFLGKDTRVLTDKEVDEFTNNLNIFSVDGEDKVFEYPYDGVVDEGSIEDYSDTQDVVYEEGKFKVPASIFDFSFKANGDTKEVNTAWKPSGDMGYEPSVGDFEVKKNPEIKFELVKTAFTGQQVEFTVSTIANDYSWTPVKGTGGLSNPEAIEKLEYYEVQDGNWYTLPDTGFGPADGFPLQDATSKFRVTFKETGTFDVNFVIKSVYSDAQIASASTTITVIDTAEVENVTQLNDALAMEYVENIKLIKDIVTPNSIVIGRDVTLDGNGKTISFETMPESWIPNGDNYVVKAYNADVVIKNVKLTNSRVGLLVSSANVTLEGTIDVSGNAVGGIESSKSANEGLPNPSLNTLNATIVNAEEGTNVTMWEDKVTGTIETNLTAVDAKAFGEENQTFYFNNVPETAMVNSVAGLKYALENEFTEIKLIGDLTIEENITIDRDVTINLNGNDMNVTKRMFVTKGNVNVTGEGVITSTDFAFLVRGSVDATVENHTVLTIDKDVTIKSSVYAVGIRTLDSAGVGQDHAFGVVVNVKGKLLGNGDAGSGIYIDGDIQDNEGNVPVVNVMEGAVITSANAADNIGIYAAGYAVWNINTASISGYGAGIGLKAGKFNIENSTILGTGAFAVPTENNNGITDSGAAIQVDTNASYADHIELNIAGGKVSSSKGYAILEHTGQSNILKVNITAGVFESFVDNDEVTEKTVIYTTDNFKHTEFITGGKYTSDITKYLAPGYSVTLVDGYYEVSKNA